MYKRPVIGRPEKNHPLIETWGSKSGSNSVKFTSAQQIYYGQFIAYKDQPGWILKELEELHNDGNLALHSIAAVIKSVKALDVSDFKPEIAQKKLAEPIHNARKGLLNLLRPYINKTREDVNKVQNSILRVTEPDHPSDTTKALLAELRNQEIRTLVRETDPKDRHALIRGNLAFLRACVESPDDLISPENLIEMRREFAFRGDPSLRDLEDDTKTIYETTRRRAAEINSTSIRLLQNEKIDDPLTPMEHYEVFFPETPEKILMAQKRIQSYQREQDQKERRRLFDEKNPGLNMRPGERAKRV